MYRHQSAAPNLEKNISELKNKINGNHWTYDRSSDVNSGLCISYLLCSFSRLQTVTSSQGNRRWIEKMIEKLQTQCSATVIPMRLKESNKRENRRQICRVYFITAEE